MEDSAGVLTSASDFMVETLSNRLGRNDNLRLRTDSQGNFKTTYSAAGDSYHLIFKALPANSYVTAVQQGGRTLPPNSPVQTGGGAIHVLVKKDAGLVSVK